MEITIKFNENDVINHSSDVQQVFSMVTAIAMLNKESMVQEMTKSGGTKEQKVVQSQGQEAEKQNPKNTPQSPRIVQIHRMASNKAKRIENGIEKVQALIKKYGVNKIDEMDRSKYEAFAKDLEELI